jgi:hypothetical protein
MKYLKTFESNKSNKQIENICDDLYVCNYTINSDGLVDVDDHVDLSYMELNRLPINFGTVKYNFSCSNNKLTTLEGSPKTVGDDFYCTRNKLTSLEGGPDIISGDFDCSNNKLKTLEGFPKSIGGYVDCSRNDIINFKGFPDNMDLHYIDFRCNPVYEIYSLFGNMKCITLINEFDVIQGDKVRLDRLEMIYQQLDWLMPSTPWVSIKLKNYEII